jgi:hypothetical protein
MELYKMDDPRDPWMRARRIELVRYAHEKGMASEISEQMPKDLIVKRMKAKGLPPPSVPPRPLGGPPRSGDTSPDSHHYTGPQVEVKQDTVTVDAADLAEREWAARQDKPFDQMDIRELRSACKAKGIALKRTDRMPDMKAKLRGEQNAA